jgi:uncharacterized membrane protein YeaQ/YmgE (transglycosylase-associated protein family)
VGMIRAIISILISGLIVGALGRLAVPGPNPMGIGLTILVGIGGAIVGTFVGVLLGGNFWLIVILQVLAAAGIIYLMQRNRGLRSTY